MGSEFHAAKAATIDDFVGFADGGAFPRWPLEIFLEVSNLCDLKCAMCNTFSALHNQRRNVVRSQERGFLELDRVVEPLQPLLEHALQVHAFGFGEPTIHPQFRELLETLSRYEVMLDFFTNGMHLSDALCDFLVSRRVWSVTLSFSGATKADYESIYLGGEFERVLQGIRRLADAKARAGSDFPKIQVNSIAFRHQVERFPEFVRLLAQHGANVIHLKPLATYDQIPELHGHVSIPRRSVELPLLEEARRIAAEYGVIVADKPYEGLLVESDADQQASLAKRHLGSMALDGRAVALDEFPRIARERQVRSADYAPAPREESLLLPLDAPRHRAGGIPCLEPFKTLYVAYNGDLAPCCFRRTGLHLGRLGEAEGATPWHGERWESLRRGIVTDRSYPEALCKKCLDSGAHPRSHGLKQKVNQYAQWFNAGFGTPFAPSTVAAARQVAENEPMLAARQAAQSG